VIGTSAWVENEDSLATKGWSNGTEKVVMKGQNPKHHDGAVYI